MRPLDPRVLPHLRPATRALLGVLAGGLSGGLLTVAQAFAVGTLLVRLVDPGATPGSWHGPAWWLAAITVARAVAAYAVDRCSAVAASQVSQRLRHRLVRAALDLDASALAQRRTGELTLLATRGMAAIEPYLTRYLPTLVMAGLLPAATVLAIFWLDWLSGLIVLLTLPLLPVFAILIGHATAERADRQWRLLSTLSGHFLDVVRGLPTLVAFRRAGAQSASIRAITARYRHATLDTLRLAFLSSGALELIATISVALVAVDVGLRLAHGSLDFQTSMIVLLLAPEAYWPVRRVGAEFHAAAEGTAAFARASELLAEAGPAAAEGGPVDPGPLTLSGLTLAYPGRDRPAVESLSAHIPATGLTAITGPSGCGKSTLLAGLLGELRPADGEIRVGSAPLGELDPAAWRAAVAWAPQRPFLTAGTIAENLRLGRPDADEATLWAALEQVALADVVRRLPGGLDTPLGEDGAGLSAGQRARLALARVVVADRPYVFLDEPTAHLDSATEAVLLGTLTRLAQTACVVVVAHRPAVVAAADAVLELPAPPPVGAPAPGVRPVGSDPGSATTVPAGSAAPDDAPSRWGRPWIGTLLGTLSVAAGVALTATASWLITRASEQPPVLYLMVAIVGVRTFGLARPALRYAERIVSHDAALRLLAERRAQVYDALVPLVPGRLGARRGDVLTSVVDDVDSFVDRQLRVRQPAWTATGVVGLATVLAGALAWQAGLVVAGSGLVGLLGGWAAWRGVASAEPEFVAARGRLSTWVEQTLGHARDLVLWGADGAALAELDHRGDALSTAIRRSTAAIALGRVLPLLAGGGGLLAMAAFVPPGATSPALLALLVMLPIALVDALAPLPDAGALAVRTAAAQRRLDALSAVEPAVCDPADPLVVPLERPVVASDAVSAGWGETDALREVSLRLEPGDRVGLVGVSGTGKSTYAALLMRFLDPRGGHQRLDDQDLRALALDHVRRATGLVDDDPYVFGSTVAENVRLARPEATDDDVAAALDAAHLGPWLDGLPRGMHTHVGEGHAQVSGGERARIGLARAHLADPPVLVLDEPTAHLDADTARAVAAEVLAAGRERSIVWITHGTIGLAEMDRVVTLPEAPEPAGA